MMKKATYPAHELVKSHQLDDKAKSSSCKARESLGMRRTEEYVGMTKDKVQRSRWYFCKVVTIFIALSLCLITQNCFATQWAKTYGGVNYERAYSIQQTSDGGYIVAGETQSFGAGESDVWILKLDHSGTISWQKTYGGSDDDYALSIQQTSDGGYIVAGSTVSFGAGENDMWILKLDQSGNVTWQKTYGGSGSDLAYSIQQTSDGGYIVAGTINYNNYIYTSGDFWVLKLDHLGNDTWQKTYAKSACNFADSIQQTADGGYILAGRTGVGPNTVYDIWILKLDHTGNATWQKAYGESVDFRLPLTIQQTADGGYIVATNNFLSDMLILKLDSSGTVSWQIYYAESWPGGCNVHSIQQTTDGGYIVAGSTRSFGAGSSDMWILKIDHAGTVSWQKTYGGSNVDRAVSIQQTTDGGYIVAGETQSFGDEDGDLWILKLDSNGDINNADFIGTSTAAVIYPPFSGVATSATITTPSPTIDDTSVIPQVSTADIETQCFAHDWFPIDPPPQDKLNGVWGYRSDDPTPIHIFYAVGEEGLIIRYDGTELVGTGTHTSDDLYGIWGSSGDDIYAVGDNGAIIQYDGDWTKIEPPPFTINLKDVWGSASNDVYAVGDGGKIAHYNGTGWSEKTSPTTDNLTSIWGSSLNDYVAVGEGGRIIKYNGSWSNVTSPTSNDLSEVWGGESNNIYAVGKHGTIIHYDGTSWTDWTETESPTSANLKGIWGSSGNDIFAVGEHGTILYYDGDSWQKMDSGSQDTLISTFGTLNPRVMVVGYGVLSLGGPSVQGKICNSCSGVGINEVTVEFFADTYQTAQTDSMGVYPTLSSRGATYELSFSKTGYYISKEITVDLPNNHSIIDHATYLLPVSPGYEYCISGTVTKTVQVGPEGMERENKRGVQNMVVKLYHEGTEVDTVTDVGGNYHFTGLSSSLDPYKVEPVVTTSECTIDPSEHNIMVPITVASQYDFELVDCPTEPLVEKAYWSNMTSGTNNVLYGIWGDSATDIFAVGDGGVIVHYNGTDWSPQTSGTDKNLKGVWGVLGSSPTEVYAVGEGGTIIRTTTGGSSWSPMDSGGTTNELNAIWGDSASDIFAVGNSGTIVHYNGTFWSGMTIDATAHLLSVWGNSGSDVYAMGNSHKESYWKRTVIHYDGTDWSEVETGNGVALMSSWGGGVDDVTATGSFGSILRYDGTDWKQIGGPTERTLNAMWGASSSNIFAVGFNGVIAHYDGTGWDVRGKDKPDLYGIWGNSATEVFAVGDKGTILTYDGDMDGDGTLDGTDNCPEVANDQTNSDGDTLGDACDNCPNDDNEDQVNSDYDEYGNVCDDCPFDTDNDIDNDDICGDVDNCPNTPNGPVLGTCINCGNPASIGPPCTSDIGQCENGFCSMDQEDYDGNNVGDVCEADISGDTYPPNGNACVDICECEGDFDGDTAVGANDVTTFLDDFGRNQYNQPCSICIIGSGIPPTNFCQADVDCGEGGECGPDPVNSCNGDFDCDGAVASNDVTKFLEDFGRNTYNNPCPQNCQTGAWCSY